MSRVAIALVLAVIVGLVLGNWLLVIALVVCILSIVLHPYANCEACKGRGRHQGSVFNYAHRQCHKCSGTGRKQRLGAWALGRGQPRQGITRLQ